MDNRGRSISSLRNLAQYRGMSDEEILTALGQKDLNQKVQERIKKLEEEYDLSDMKYHDRLLLEMFMALSLRLQEEESKLQKALDESGIDEGDASRVERRLSTMRNDMLSIQKELGISRLLRKDTTDDSPIVMFQDIRARAKRFLEQRLTQLNCKKCGMQLAKAHFTYPQNSNKIILTCGRCSALSEYTSEEALAIEKDNPYK